MFGLFKHTPPLDEDSAEWLFESFAWALRQFGHEDFQQHTQLILPDNKHFPGRATDPDGMAHLIFERVVQYAGMPHWPFYLQNAQLCGIQAPKDIELGGPTRVWDERPFTPDPDGITLYYDESLITNPAAMITEYARALAHYLGQTSNEPPPGGAENWAQQTEVLAVFLGFGVMSVNSALELRGSSCASCGGPARRNSSLARDDITYALALFAVLKDIPSSAVTKHLTSSVRGLFKQCRKDIELRTDALNALRHA